MLSVCRCHLTKLVIVESPNKVPKIDALLGKVQDWSFGRKELKACCSEREGAYVLATVGHFLTHEKLTIQPMKAPKKFPQNVFPRKFCSKWKPDLKNNKAAELRALLTNPNDFSEVIIATDPDREGELIGLHAYQQIFHKKSKVPYSRAYIHSITLDGVTKAMEERLLSFIDKNLAEAAEARHVMDKIFGFMGSSVVSTLKKTLKSVGRVQTPAIILVNEREERINRLINEHETSFGLNAVVEFVHQGVTFSRKVPLTLSSNVELKTSSDADQLLQKLQLENIHSYSVGESGGVACKEKQSPLPLTMQTAILMGNRRLGMSGKQVSGALQDLFQRGYITYPRTDSTRIDPNFADLVRAHIAKTYGREFVDVSRSGDKQPKKIKEGNVEDAHEALRPTKLDNIPAALQDVDQDTKNLYQLIYDTTIASCMISSKIESCSATITATAAEGTDVKLHVAGCRTTQRGWQMALGTFDEEEATDSDMFSAVRHLSEDASSFHIVTANAVEKKPTLPPRHTEGSLIEALKKNGIGRPSTYPTIVQKLLDRFYVTQRKNSLMMTDTGRDVVKMSKRLFPSVVDLGFTAKFEEQLDEIAQGKATQHAVLSSFYQDLLKMITALSDVPEASFEKLADKEIDFDKICQKCKNFAQLRASHIQL